MSYERKPGQREHWLYRAWRLGKEAYMQGEQPEDCQFIGHDGWTEGACETSGVQPLGKLNG